MVLPASAAFAAERQLRRKQRPRRWVAGTAVAGTEVEPGIGLGLAGRLEEIELHVVPLAEPAGTNCRSAVAVAGAIVAVLAVAAAAAVAVPVRC